LLAIYLAETKNGTSAYSLFQLREQSRKCILATHFCGGKILPFIILLARNKVQNQIKMCFNETKQKRDM
jgi:hypothetical protein